MINCSYVVLLTQNLKQQNGFYKNVLNLDELFKHEQAVGLGKNTKLHLILRKEENPNSHHQQENKGPILLTFQFDINDENIILNKIKNSNCKIRGFREFPNYSSKYYFIEDIDANEICLEFCNKIIPTT